MKIAGIIAEYNPFHLGHCYQLEETRRLTKADYLIVVLSGNFVQRGEPAIIDKSLRTRMALLGGADCVLELPAPFACSSAEDFASAAVSLLHKLGAVHTLSFGSECGDIHLLTQAALLILQEPAIFSQTLKEQLCHGASYPQARSTALSAAGAGEPVCTAVNQPNNLLGIEYLKALFCLNSPIQPFTLPRKGNAYHDLSLNADGYSSASALRRMIYHLYQHHSFMPSDSHNPKKHIFNDNPSDLYSQFSSKEAYDHENQAFSLKMYDLYQKLLAHLPEAIRPLYPREPFYPVFPDDCSALLNYRILSSQLSREAFTSFLDLSPELAGRLTRQTLDNLSFTRRICALKTRQYTYTRISRCLLHLLLDIRQKEMETYRKNGFCSYARILGLKKTASPLLKALKTHSTIPLITKPADALALLSPEAVPLWEKDIFCSHVYRTIFQQKYPVPFPDEYRRPLVIL